VCYVSLSLSLSLFLGFNFITTAILTFAAALREHQQRTLLKSESLFYILDIGSENLRARLLISYLVFVVYLTTLSVSQTIQSRIVG
jgi:hypothetical protein